MKRLAIFAIFFAISLSFIINKDNYLYLNSSYSRQTVSLSMCFHFNQTTTVEIQSPIIQPSGNHITVASFKEDTPIVFQPAFDSKRVGYNSYGDGQHWFGYKYPLPSQKEAQFHKIVMKITQKEHQTTYVFLSPMFRMPLNGILVSPVNTLYSCKGILISYLHYFEETDLFLFTSQKSASIAIQQSADWTYKQDQASVTFLRHKSKRNAQATILYKKQPLTQCILSPSLPSNILTFSQEKDSYSLQDLLQTKSLALESGQTQQKDIEKKQNQNGDQASKPQQL